VARSLEAPVLESSRNVTAPVSTSADGAVKAGSVCLVVVEEHELFRHGLVLAEEIVVVPRGRPNVVVAAQVV